MAKIDLKSEDLLFYAETGNDYFYVTYDPKYDHYKEFYKIYTYHKEIKFGTPIFKNETDKILYAFVSYFLSKYVLEIPKIKVDKFNFRYDLNYVMKSVDKYFGSWWDQSNFTIENDAVGYLGYLIGTKLQKNSDPAKVVSNFPAIAEKAIQLTKDMYKSLDDRDLVETIEYLTESYKESRKLSDEEKDILLQYIMDNYYHTSFDPYEVIKKYVKSMNN